MVEPPLGIRARVELAAEKQGAFAHADDAVTVLGGVAAREGAPLRRRRIRDALFVTAPRSCEPRPRSRSLRPRGGRAFVIDSCAIR